MTGISDNPIPVTAVTQFFNSTDEDWANLSTPIPNGIVAISSNTGRVKQGDGTHLWSQLPTLFMLGDILTIFDTLSDKSDVGHQHNKNALTDIADFLLTDQARVLSAGIGNVAKVYTSPLQGAFTPALSDGVYHSAVIASGTNNLTLNKPSVMTGTTAVDLTIYMSTSNAAGTGIVLGNGLVEGPGDGLIIPFGQIYRFDIQMNGASGIVRTSIANNI